MTDPEQQAATQLRNIEESTGMSVGDFTAAVREAGLEKHGQIVAFLKADHGLTHGNANLIAHHVRESLAGGPASADELLAAQYKGAKAGLRPLYEELEQIAAGLGNDVDTVVQKTGVSFRRKKQFALVQCPSSKRVQLGLNLAEPPADGRVKEAKGMCSHKVDLTDPADIDDSLVAVLRQAYDHAG